MRLNLFSVLILLIVLNSYSQWTQVGNQVQLADPADSIILNGNINNTPANKLTVEGGVQFSDKEGNPSYIIVPPAVAGTMGERAEENRKNIQGAIDKLWQYSAGKQGGVVMLMRGIYPVAKNGNNNYCIGIKNGITIKGASSEATMIHPIESGSENNHLEVFRTIGHETTDKDEKGNDVINYHAPVGIIRDVWINGRHDSNNLRQYITGINIGNYRTGGSCPDFLVENVLIIQCELGILVQSYGSTISNCKIGESNTVGIALRGYDGEPPLQEKTDITTMTRVTGCSIGGSDTCLIISAQGCKIENNVFDIKNHNAAIGVWLDDDLQLSDGKITPCHSNDISNNWFQSNQAHEKDADGNLKYEKQQFVGISIGNCPNTKISCNVFDGLFFDKIINFYSTDLPKDFTAFNNMSNFGPADNPNGGYYSYPNKMEMGSLDVKDDLKFGYDANVSWEGHYLNFGPTSEVDDLKVLKINGGGQYASRIDMQNKDNSSCVTRIDANSGADNYINNGGKFGIGTSNPTEKLDVNGNIKLGNNPSLKWSGNYLNFEPPANDNSLKVLNIKGNSTYASRIDMQNSSNSSCVMRFDANNGANSYINNSGKFGIGTSNPTEKLDVNGSLKLGDNPSLKWTGHYLNFEPPAGDNSIKILNIKANSTYGSRIDMQNAGNTQCVIRFNASNYGNSYVNNSGGKFGVGTDNPSEKLDVKNGNVSIEEGRRVYLDSNSGKDTYITYSDGYIRLFKNGTQVAQW